MSKGARNRAKRSKTSEKAASEERARAAIEELLLVESFKQYVELIERFPELKRTSARDELTAMSSAPGYGPLFERARVLLDGASSGDLEAPWQAHQDAADEMQLRIDAVAPLQVEATAAIESGNYSRALEYIDQALPVALESGFGMLVCVLLEQRGVALLNSTSVARAHDLDASIEAFQAALEVAVGGVQAAGILMHLGLAYGERIHGDRADNMEQAVELLRNALAELEDAGDEDGDPVELRAMVLTNLSVVLGRSEREDHAAVAREAVALCRDALRTRSIARDADDWAFSQLNLGEALRNLSEFETEGATNARDAFQAVVDNATEIRNPTLIGYAHHALGRLEYASTQRSPEDYIDEYEAGTINTASDSSPALQAARGHLQTACDLISDPILRARARVSLSYVLADLGDANGAIDAARAALKVLRPTTAPYGCKEAGWQLGALLAARDDWRGAAEALRDAVEAAELAFHARLDSASREREARSSGNLHRWAAYAIARAGDAEAAALVIDAGRAREIGRRLGGDTSLVGVPDELQANYRATVEALGRTPIGSDLEGASRALQQIVETIREVPGYADFGAGPRWDEVTSALEPGWPLIYVNPTPAGTLLIVLSITETMGCSSTATFVDATSNDVYFRLLLGDGAEEATDDGASYLFSLGSGEPLDFNAALDQALPWLGEMLGRPISEALRAVGATGATLLPSGPLGLAPIHAAPWQTDSGPKRLVDEFDIRFAPSGVVCANALRRAARTRPPRLVALADPQGNLPAAHPEVAEIAAQFDASDTFVAVGSEADLTFLRRNVGRATHVHLACHARGGLFDSTEAAISLASGPVSAIELTSVAPLDARLVVVSACESALSELSGLPDEVVSLGTALMASGSACAIASLWSVDDLATALLMTRLYQEMLGSKKRPPEALRCAQLWLRDLTEVERRRFLDRHDALAREFGRRASLDRRESDRHKEGASRSANSKPYAHPEYWAPFVAIGV